MQSLHPSFFIVGAPKCGTTSLASWLADHEQIFIPKVKELHYWSSDITPDLGATSRKEYSAYFSKVPKEKIIAGEASTGYLRSSVAVPSILSEIPDAKMIACVRNPIDMVASVHSQLVRRGREPATRLEDAWELQSDRANGKYLPSGDPAERFMYGSICALGTQVEALIDRAGWHRVKILVLDDMRNDPRGIYRQVLEFLGIEDDGRSEFPVLNMRRAPRWNFVTRGLRHLARLKAGLQLRWRTGLGDFAEAITTQIIKPETMDPELRARLAEYFESEVAKLEALVGRDMR